MNYIISLFFFVGVLRSKEKKRREEKRERERETRDKKETLLVLLFYNEKFYFLLSSFFSFCDFLKFFDIFHTLNKRIRGAGSFSFQSRLCSFFSLSESSEHKAATPPPRVTE